MTQTPAEIANNHRLGLELAELVDLKAKARKTWTELSPLWWRWKAKETLNADEQATFDKLMDKMNTLTQRVELLRGRIEKGKAK